MENTSRPHHRIRIRDALAPSCASMERKFLPIFFAQPFRRLQHLVFGLTEDEWNILSMYFARFEDLGIAVQVETGLRREARQLKRILIDELRRGQEPSPDLVHYYTDILYRRTMNKEALILAFHKWQETAEGLKDTAIYRGLSSSREAPHWWYTHCLRKQCAEAGGCCGRNCKCCLSSVPDRDFKTWGGHCTPACPCCLKQMGVDKAMDRLGGGREPRFDSKEGRKDQVNRKMLRCYAWCWW